MRCRPPPHARGAPRLAGRENEHEPAALDVQDKLKQSIGQRSLYHVCCAYSNFDKELGYTQGMGFLAGIFLMYRDEESSFWCLERLLNGDRHKLRTLYTPGFPLLQKYYYIVRAASHPPASRRASAAHPPCARSSTPSPSRSCPRCMRTWSGTRST